ncbi:hypothetical protein C8R47DRAFT_1181245 [Mycena vitilis]|nr:hypothetical protein C8R47DRAFT_1181245 [Mycena vitilis]
MHRRRSSVSDDGDSLVVITPPADAPSIPLGPPPRTRVQSTPQQPRHQRNASISGLPLNIAPPPTAGPYRTAFPASPFRSTFGHGGHVRTRSFSSPFSPTSPSPLATSTSFADQMDHPLPASQSAPSQVSPDVEQKPQPRRHSRLHSRNLSVFFPRPGALPEHTIDEDGAQELVVPPTLGAGFTFGKTPPGEPAPSAPPLTPSSSASRRGHHHKHSVSHTFFSFLEPQSSETASLVTQPTPTPMSPWMPISPFVGDASKPQVHEVPEVRESSAPFLAAATVVFLLGGTLWVQGQQTGSLAVTALGYWVVFDAIGVAIPHVTLLVSKPYAAARSLPVLLFAQSVYLMFSAVYICKEALEHLLLSAGEGHHHHAGDEDAGIEFPVITTFFALIALAITALTLDNHARLVALAGNRIPPLHTFFTRAPSYAAAPPYVAEPTAPPARALSNPYALTPILLASGILLTALGTPAVQHRVLDLAAAGAGSAATFAAAYRACAVLGAVLLQTAPSRGQRGGRMEAFLRAMRDVERHPQVLHLPAPHIWQLAASGEKTASSAHRGGEKGEGSADALVVTMELHVRATLPDDDALALTRWVRERVVGALGLGGGGEGGRAPAREAEVTVGIVRG